MKVNLKKLGAIVAGATVLASSAAFAGLMFGSTTLVDDNGAPVAKVVLGGKSAPSDGVAGALIAGKMVSGTFKSQTLTAQVSGTAACDAGEGAGTGTCAISNEKARLEITVPGSVAAGTWTGNNLIGDFLNRELLDREPSDDNTDTDQAYEMGGSDTATNANPFTDAVTGDIGPGEEFMYRVAGDQFSVFADRTLTDDDSGDTYVEKQALWLTGDNHYDTDVEEIVGKLTFLAYTLKFDGPGGDELGIPECTEAEDQDFSDCKDMTGDSNIDDATETHRLKVWFLGEEWIISEMEAPNDSDVTNENEVRNGGSIKLAKEAVSGILNQGESLPVDSLKFQLDDLEAHGDTTSAIISVLDANGNILKKDKIPPGETKELMVGGKAYRFHVYKVAPGYTFGAKWADVAIFAEELELVDGQELNQDEGDNEGYMVALGWKNMEGTTGAPVADGGDPEKPDTLRTVVLYSDDIEEISSSGEEELQEGEYVSIVLNPEVWKLSYKGLDITSEDRESLTFELKTSDKNVDTEDFDTDGAGGDECDIYAPYVQVKSGATGSVFEIGADEPSGSTLSDNEFLVALNGADCYDDDTPGYSSPGDGTVFMQLSPTRDYGYADYASPGLVVEYSDIGDGDTDFAPPYGGAIVIQQFSDLYQLGGDFGGDDLMGDLLGSAGGDGSTVSNAPDFMFGIAEKAGVVGNDFVDYFMFGARDTTSTADVTFDFSSADGAGFDVTSDDQEVLYGHATANPLFSNSFDYPGASDVCDDTGVTNEISDEFYCSPARGGTGLVSGPVSSDPVELVEEGYISERGSVFQSIDDDQVEFDMAHKLANAQWFLAAATTTAADASKTIVTLGEGESTTVSGVTVKVLEITEDVGACSAAGGSVACTADMSGVSAVIMPNNAATVDVAMPYTGTYGSLVILDSEAVGVNTLVSVGGDAVNSVTADLLQGSAVDWTAERKVVREVVQGSKIVVAGRDAADTLEAAQDFVAQVKAV